MLIAAAVLAVGVAFPHVTNAATTQVAQIRVNGQRSATVPYGSDVVVSWYVLGLGNCVVTPGDWTGTSGARQLTHVAQKQTFKLSCADRQGTATSYATFAVAPPTFDYVGNLSVVASKGLKQQIAAAESKYLAGDYDQSKKLLDITVAKVDKMIAQQKASTEEAGEYEAVIGLLKQTLSADYVTPTPDTIPDDVVTPGEIVIGQVGPSVPCGGGYPDKWCKIPLDSAIDSWGMYNRESVSYTAYRVHADFLAGRNSRDMPYWGGVGNANQWDDNARRLSIPVDTNPQPGAIAISNAGLYGHAMYVERVDSLNGQPVVLVSQYNIGWDGNYSEAWRPIGGLVFIHF